MFTSENPLALLGASRFSRFLEPHCVFYLYTRRLPLDVPTYLHALGVPPLIVHIPDASVVETLKAAPISFCSSVIEWSHEAVQLRLSLSVSLPHHTGLRLSYLPTTPPSLCTISQNASLLELYATPDLAGYYLRGISALLLLATCAKIMLPLY